MEFQEESKARFSIDAYGDGGFRIQGTRREGALLIHAGGVLPWSADTLEKADMKSLQPMLDEADPLDFLIFGTGTGMRPVPKTLKIALRKRNIGCEGMDTGAACRTYNILLMEDRRVAAALLPVE